jgi:polysaccharide deacetylase family protein (PEP-CTERM system associated)
MSSRNPAEVDRTLNALSFDMEEWFCVSNFENAIRREDWPHLESRIEQSTRRILGLLEQHDVKATFFILGWIAERHPDLIKTIAAGGHEIASHGYGHHLVCNLSPSEFREDLARSLEILAKVSGTQCLGYRAPSFSLKRSMTWAWQILIEEGMQYDSSIVPAIRARSGDLGASRYPFAFRVGQRRIIELPLSTIAALGTKLPVAGGGYFRLYPFSITRWAIGRINKEGFPAVIYLHPWEFDPDQPKPSASRLSLLRHRIGIRSVYGRLHRLLEEFSFGPLAQVLRELQVPDVSLGPCSSGNGSSRS